MMKRIPQISVEEWLRSAPASAYGTSMAAAFLMKQFLRLFAMMLDNSKRGHVILVV